MSPSFRDLPSGFLRSSERSGDRACVRVDGETVTYRELRARAVAIAATLCGEAPEADPPLTAILADRTAVRFAGVLGILLAGHGYVPLNPAFPAARTRAMLEAAECRSLVADSASMGALEACLAEIERPLLLLLPDVEDVRPIAERWPAHRVLGRADLRPGNLEGRTPAVPDDIAYLMFTSGSTGRPKGVPVTHGNVRHFLDAVVPRLEITEEDRLSHTFDLTFDLSVFDLFAAWEAGACVCCPSRADLLAPGRWLIAERLTVWFSVPSRGVLMSRLRLLEPDAYPDLRLALFCGEPLTASLARAWRLAAPGAVLENLYGPTELTVACTGYRWDDERSPGECENGVVPIGWPFPGLTALVLDEDGREVAPGETGELLVSGPQRTPGYWRDERATAEAHVVPMGRDELFYRTGDRVRRPLHPDGPLRFLGRWDQQVKLRGFRVELGEIEDALRQAAGTDDVAAIGWPRTETGVGGVVGFVGGEGVDGGAILAKLRERLPAYMLPRPIHVLPELPRNANGKLDRGALLARLERGSPA